MAGCGSRDCNGCSVELHRQRYLRNAANSRCPSYFAAARQLQNGLDSWGPGDSRSARQSPAANARSDPPSAATPVRSGSETQQLGYCDGTSSTLPRLVLSGQIILLDPTQGIVDMFWFDSGPVLRLLARTGLPLQALPRIDVTFLRDASDILTARKAGRP